MKKLLIITGPSGQWKSPIQPHIQHARMCGWMERTNRPVLGA